ncbi:regulatory protein RecX [Sphingomonas sp. PR090111-T3T-6A]|uniref:regulatory protein RecX n=1 Tax=Sphingomonas sp. PR090111-T3T-6A TaxID=685778 RepID=UPI00039D39B2|nr:RecX family transcriptional regulator [Sphingomonas sp. PR090111-T3T-6A]
MTFRSTPRNRPPLDLDGLERLALAYVSRFATSRARLRDYLCRKLDERGWAGGEGENGTEAVTTLVERFARLGYVDDRALAEARARSLARKGYGARRLSGALDALGIAGEDAASARQQAEEGAWEAALRFAERRRIGPFAASVPDEAGRRRAFAAMMRAGHSLDCVKRILESAPGDVPTWDD